VAIRGRNAHLSNNIGRTQSIRGQQHGFPLNFKEGFQGLSHLFIDRRSSRPPLIRRLNDLVVTGTFFAPSLILYGAFLVLPLIVGLAYSFTSWNGIGDKVTFIGLENFRKLLTDPRFFSTLKHTLTITATECLILSALSLVIAELIETSQRRRMMGGVFASFFVFPFFLGTVMVTVLWRYILDFKFGFINSALRGIGLGKLAIDWLGDPNVVLLTIIGVEVWSSIGIYTLIYLTALQAIPSSLVETSKLDGAGIVRRFTTVKAPFLVWAFTVNTVIILNKGLSSFETVLLLTQGGPGFSSETVSYYIYWMGFLGSRQGYGSAVSIILFCATSVISLLFVAYVQKRTIQEAL
jgi:ABC-type sugar transport system permease subunit